MIGDGLTCDTYQSVTCTFKRKQRDICVEKGVVYAVD